MNSAEAVKGAAEAAEMQFANKKAARRRHISLSFKDYSSSGISCRATASLLSFTKAHHSQSFFPQPV